MSVNGILKTALEPIAPVKADAYEGYTKEYLTFGYNSIPADYGDDEPAHERILIQVHYFAPQGVNTLAKRRRIKAALRGAGMTCRHARTPQTATGSISFLSANAVSA